MFVGAGEFLTDEAQVFRSAGSPRRPASVTPTSRCVAQAAPHGPAPPDTAGQGVANPAPLTLSAAMLLDRRGQRDGNDRLQRAAALVTIAVGPVLDNPATRTRDIGGTLDAADFAPEIRRIIEHTGETA